MKKQSNLTLVDAETTELHKRFDELLSKTNKNNPSREDVMALRRLLEDHPKAELWKRIAGIMSHAESYTFDSVSPLSPGLHEVFRCRQTEIRRNLGYQGASEMEQLLISHVALCWLRMALAEFHLSKETSKSHSLTVGMYCEKRLLMAQRRFTRACETLSKVRRLGVMTGRQEQPTRAAKTA